MEMTNTVETFTPANIIVIGKTKSERQLSVAHHASGQAKMALCAMGGKVGAAVRSGVANAGLQSIAKAAAWPTCNYRPAGEYFAAMLGEPFVITTRAAFESLADQFEARIAKAKMAKNEGFVIDKKTGAQKPSAAHALALKLKADAVDMAKLCAQFSAEAKARAESKADAKVAIEA